MGCGDLGDTLGTRPGMWGLWGHSGDRTWDGPTCLWHTEATIGVVTAVSVSLSPRPKGKRGFLTPHKTSGRGRWWLGGTDGDRMVTRSCAGCRDGISAPGIPSGSAFPPFLPRSHARFRSFPGTFPNPRSAPGRSHRARTGQVWTLRYLPGATCAPVPVPVCSARSLPATRGR